MHGAAFYGKIRKAEMKTLIFNGSPRKKGETAYMIKTLQEKLGGEFKVVDAYRARISPCIDCRWCFEHAGCAVQDEWQEILSFIEECDHIVIASPVYFEEVTGMLLAVLSRLQTYFSARYLRKEEPVPKKKTGAVLLAAGSIGPREKAESTAEMLLRQMSCDSLGTVYVNRTDKVPVRDCEDIIQEIEELAEKLR